MATLLVGDWGKNIASGLPAGASPGLFDDLSGGNTTVTPPSLSSTIPAADGSVQGAAFTAYAFPANGTVAGSQVLSEIQSVTLKIVPHGSSTPVFTGTATGHNDSQGPYEAVNVSGLAAGLYNADWTVTDVNGDTASYSELFAAQPGGTLPVTVVCQVTGSSHGHPVITCTVGTSSQSGTSVTATLERGRSTYAVGRTVAHQGIAHLKLIGSRRVRRGSYTVEVTAAHGRSIGVRHVKLTLR